MNKEAVRLEEVEAQAELLKSTYPHLHLLSRLIWLGDAVAGFNERFRQIELRLGKLEKGGWDVE